MMGISVLDVADLSGDNIVHVGCGQPHSGLGINGQHWIDRNAGLMFGPKTNGLWPETGRRVVVPASGVWVILLEDVRYSD